jgi:hypothetical protein
MPEIDAGQEGNLFLEGHLPQQYFNAFFQGCLLRIR